jgi:hypothetical protein
MIDCKDRVLSELVRKKRSLLNSLLAMSIRSALIATQPERIVRLRSDILSMLEKNDSAILTRERQTGINASSQEQEQFSSISVLLTSIRDNNQAALAKLELAKKAFELEKLQLEKEKKLTGYVYQTKTMNQYRKKNKHGHSDSSLVKGIL